MFELSTVPPGLKTTLEKLFNAPPGVDLSIPSVLEGQKGACIAIKVDHMTSPTAAQIEHGSFTVFAGRPERETAAAFIKN